MARTRRARGAGLCGYQGYTVRDMDGDGLVDVGLISHHSATRR
jgi:hypothetical protein